VSGSGEIRCGCSIISAAAAYLLLAGYFSRQKIETRCGNPGMIATEIAGSPSSSRKWSKKITSRKSASAILRIVFGLAVVGFAFFTYHRIIPRVEAGEAVELFGHRVFGASGTGCCVAPPSVASV